MEQFSLYDSLLEIRNCKQFEFLQLFQPITNKQTIVKITKQGWNCSKMSRFPFHWHLGRLSVHVKYSCLHFTCFQYMMIWTIFIKIVCSQMFTMKDYFNPLFGCNYSCLHGSYDGLSLMTFTSIAWAQRNLVFFFIWQDRP